MTRLTGHRLRTAAAYMDEGDYDTARKLIEAVLAELPKPRSAVAADKVVCCEYE